MEDFSMILSETLNNIGFSKEIVRSRRNHWRESAKILNIDGVHQENLHLVIAGSKSEGITSFCESDIDFMLVQCNVICADNAELFQRMPRMPKFLTDMSETPPGYSKLKLFNARQFRRNRKRYPPHIQASLFMEESGDLFASSALLIADWRQCMCFNACGIDGTIHALSGPAFPVSNEDIETDNVHALPGVCPTVLHEFRTRKRHNSWPSIELTQDESSTAVCQLVPVGCKFSDNQWKEWRFCFIETEMRLTHSLNDTQLKMYVLLKMIKNDILKHVSIEISSYIMKNITFWISEMYDSHVFREENLVSMVMICLQFLKLAIDNYNLPYFMIPARNLLAERLEPETRRRLSDVISELLQEGPRLFLRCSKLRFGMTVLYMSPHTILKYRTTKEAVEALFMSTFLVSSYKRCGLYEGDADELLRQTMIDIVLPDWKIMSRLGLNYMPAIYERLKNLLS